MGQPLSLAETVDEVHLVLHQGDEWRNDDGHAVHEQRRELIAQALAATRGHEHEDVVSVHKAAYDFLLIALEFVKTEVFLQCYC